MTQDEPGPNPAASEVRLRELAVSLDEAADDLDADGPVPADELRRVLLRLEEEWAEQKAASSPAQRRAAR